MSLLAPTFARRERAMDLRPLVARGLVALAVAAAIGAALLYAGPQAAAAVDEAGGDLTALLRAMAALKALMAAGLIAAVLWRLGAPVGVPRLTGYGMASAAMAAGPPLIWSMAHVGLGALLLHGGLLAGLLLLWFDPATATRLSAALVRRRSRR